MMEEIFPRVREICFTSNKKTTETVSMLSEYRVLSGVHGAGHMDVFFARPGDNVVEMIDKIHPKAKDNPHAYYRI